MSELAEIEQSVNAAFDLLATAGALLKNFGPYNGLGWDLCQARSMFAAIRKYLPVAEGDQVMLLITPNCDNGWRSAKHFLHKGALATVVSISLTDGIFYVLLQFHQETYIDHKGVTQPVVDKTCFCFKMDHVVKI